MFKDYPMGKSVRKDVVPASIPHEEEAVGTREVSTWAVLYRAFPL